MPAIITQKLRNYNADNFKNTIEKNNLYVVLAKQTEWDDENVPDDVKDSTVDSFNAYEDVIALKKLKVQDVRYVAPRKDWVAGVIYDQYDDDVDLFTELNPDTNNFYQFYVLTDELNVYKCLYNNNRAASTSKPTITTPAPFTTADGYIWKYMYSVNATDALNYLTSSWMPCDTLLTDDGSAQWTSQQNAIDGSIDVILVTDGGGGYTSAPTVTINSTTGSGATATANIDVGTNTVTSITVTSRGSDYRDATIDITGGGGSGATAKAVLSPIGGHGSDPRSEIGGSNIQGKVEFDGDEGGLLPIGTTYRRVSIIKNPLDSSASTSTALYINDATLFNVGETATGSTSGASGTVHFVDYQNNILYISSVSGAFQQNENVSTQAYNATNIDSLTTGNRLQLKNDVYAGASLEPYTGELLYNLTTQKITRATDQIEKAIFIISF